MSVFRGASVGVTLTANKSKYSAELKAARAEMRAWERTVDRSLGRATGMMRGFAKAGALALGAGLALTVREGVNELVEMQKASAQTAAGIRSTGNAAKVSVKGIESLSNALMLKSGVDDQAIQSGANLLLTFTKVRNEAGKGNDIFNRTTQAALDLSTRGFGSMESASVMLGKALNDPVKGISAMSRAGVTFTKQQKAQITALVESGRVLQAQKLILKEVETQVGGSAAAYGKTLAGQVGIAREQFAGISAELVGRAVPSFLKLMNATRDALTQFDAWSHTAEGRDALRDVGNAAEFAGRTFVNVTRFLVEHRTAVRNVALAYGAFAVTQRVATGLSAVSAAINLATARTVMFMQATKGATVAQRALVAASLMNPYVAIAAGMTAIGVAAGAFLVSERRKQDELRKSAADALSQVRALQSLRDTQAQLAGERVNVERSALAVERAERTYMESVRASGRGSLESREALVALRDARLQHRSAVQSEQRAIQTANREATLSTALAFKAQTAIRDEQLLREHLAGLRVRIEKTTNGEVRRELRRQETLTKDQLKKLEAAHSTNQQVITAALRGGLTTRRALMGREAQHLAPAARAAGQAAGKAMGDGFMSSFQSALSNLSSIISRKNAEIAAAAASAGGGRTNRSARSLFKGNRPAASRGNPFLSAARQQVAIDLSPERSLAQARRQFAAAQAKLRGANSKNRADRLQSVRDAAANVAQREQAVRDAVAQRHADAAEKLRLAAEDQKAAAEEQKQAAREAHEAALDSPRAVMTLTDAMRDLERAQAEATETLDDDIRVARAALADEQRRQAEIQRVLNTVAMSDDERGSLIDQLTQSVRATNGLESSIKDMTGAAGVGSGGATLDDVVSMLRSVTQAIYEAGATEAGNVFSIAKLEQHFPGGTGLDTWRLATEANLQGAVGA